MKTTISRKGGEKMKWELKQQANDSSILELYIYDEIKAYNGYDWWEGKYIPSETSQEFFKNQLDQYKNAKDIKVYINSNGGDVFEAYGMCSLLERHPATVTCYVDGFAYSAAALFLCVADKVIMSKQATVLVHNMLTSIYGNASDLRKAADDLDKLMEANRQLFLSRMNISEDDLIEAMNCETIYTAQECIENGLADEIAGEASASELIKVNQLRTKQLNMMISQHKQMNNVLNQLRVQGPSEPDEQVNKFEFKSFFEKAFFKEEK